MGNDIYIFTNKKRYNYSKNGIVVNVIDPLLEKDCKYFKHYYETDCGKLFLLEDRYRIVKYKSKKRNKDNSGKKKGVLLKEQSIINKPSLSDYFSIAVSLFTKQKIRKIGEEFDVILSTYNPLWPTLTAEEYKKNHPFTLWIADFRDSYAFPDRDNKRLFKKKNEFLRKHLKYADLILNVNDKMHIYGNEVQPIKTVPNGYDPEDCVLPLQPEKFDFVFTGILYGFERDLRPIFQAVIGLITEGKMAKKDVRFTYAGRKRQEFEMQVQSVPEIEQYCRIYDEITRDKALELQQKSAILISGDTNNKNEEMGWSGKMYEYMMAQKPILVSLSGVHSEFLSQNLPKCGGFLYEKCRHEETFFGMKKYILCKYEEWKSTGNVTIDRDEDYVAQFSYPVIADKVWKLIERCSLK